MWSLVQRNWLLLLWLSLVWIAPASALEEADDEALLVEALTEVQGEHLDAALERIEALVRKNPKFRLAQLVYGDLLLAKAGVITDLGSLSKAPMDQVRDLRDEARTRLRHHLSTPLDGSLPGSLLKVAPSHRQVIVVDIRGSRLYVYDNLDGHLELSANYYASTGKNGASKRREGDRRTPVGVYFVTGWIGADELPDFYGSGALPIDYPNPWDRMNGRTGHGIWLHGVPSDTYSRPPRASDGCVALSNADFTAVADQVRAHRTPVIIAEQVDWVSRERLAGQERTLARALEGWRGDWESLDAALYARHYSDAFRGPDGEDRAAWIRHKNRVNRAKRFVKVRVSDLSLFRDPSDPALVVASFLQDYRSSNYSSESRKRQYWRREADGAWRIIYEGPGG